MPSPTLLQRLKERKLVQWVVAYLVDRMGGGAQGSGREPDGSLPNKPFSIIIGGKAAMTLDSPSSGEANHG